MYLENRTRIAFVDGEAQVRRYGRASELLTEMALDPDASVALIERLATGRWS